MTHDDHFRSGEARLRFRDEGAGLPVVFIHGWTLDLEIWNPQAAALAGSFRVIRYDRRGFGLSEGAPGRAADDEDLGRLLDHLQLARATLVGLSQGARVALAFALVHPNASRPRARWPARRDREFRRLGDEDFSIAEYRRLVHEEGVEAFPACLARASADATAIERRGYTELMDRMLARYPARDLLGPAAAPASVAGAGALARLCKPALVVNGELDTPIRLRAGDTLARALPLAERVVVPGAGHLPNLDNANAYNDALQAFLRRQSRAAA